MRLHLSVMAPNEVQIMTVEFAVDLGSDLCNETPNKWRQVEKNPSVIQTRVFDNICFLPTVVASVKEPYPLCAGQLQLLRAARTRLECCDRQTETRHIPNA